MSETVLLADIGGTNARFALCPKGEVKVERMKTLSAKDYPDIATAISAYLDWVDLQPVAACFAVACPAREDRIEFTNSPWRFSRTALAAEFGWRRFQTINDFEALSLGVPSAKPEGLHTLRRGTVESRGACAVLGPGTGFGVSGLVCDRHGGWVALAGAKGKTITATAINDYAVDIPASDADNPHVIVAIRMNGALMPVREKGPLWVVYPLTDEPALETEETKSKMIWQLNRLDIR